MIVQEEYETPEDDSGTSTGGTRDMGMMGKEPICSAISVSIKHN